jgi:hypothetical protein
MDNTKQQKSSTPISSWRLKERIKTVSGGLVVCLNIGVDPPDLHRPSPSSKLQCWIDPFADTPSKSLEAIGKNLLQQYEFWQPKARFKTALDPTIEDVKKLCVTLRKSSKEERVLFHYQGHGVPKPTSNGELWLFNAQFTQYIPMSILEIQALLHGPTIYVLDCSSAGHLMNVLVQRCIMASSLTNGSSQQKSNPVHSDILILGACGPDQQLSTHPDMPADLFTSCLTTPIEMAIRWYILYQNSPLKRVELDTALKIPGRLNDRKSPLGELNWILTAITDTIAWQSFPKDLFQKLYRQDIMVAGLFRNYLLAERIMKSIGDPNKPYKMPISWPTLPSTWHHSMWETWDFALETCLNQVPDLLSHGIEHYKPSTFFVDQLKAFEVWLRYQYRMRVGALSPVPTKSISHITASTVQRMMAPTKPEQLTNILQVLLSPLHRLRSLELLSLFFDLGPWAIQESLNVGVFAYLLKLLQSSSEEIRPVLIYIWARLLLHDGSTQVDLIKEDSYLYFLTAYVDLMQEHKVDSEALEVDHKGSKVSLNTESREISGSVSQSEECLNSGSTELLLPSRDNESPKNGSVLNNQQGLHGQSSCISLPGLSHSEAGDIPPPINPEKKSTRHNSKSSLEDGNDVLEAFHWSLLSLHVTMSLALFSLNYTTGKAFLIKESNFSMTETKDYLIYLISKRICIYTNMAVDLMQTDKLTLVEQKKDMGNELGDLKQIISWEIVLLSQILSEVSKHNVEQNEHLSFMDFLCIAQKIISIPIQGEILVDDECLIGSTIHLLAQYLGTSKYYNSSQTFQPSEPSIEQQDILYDFIDTICTKAPFSSIVKKELIPLVGFMLQYAPSHRHQLWVSYLSTVPESLGKDPTLDSALDQLQQLKDLCSLSKRIFSAPLSDDPSAISILSNLSQISPLISLMKQSYIQYSLKKRQALGIGTVVI